MTSLLGQVGGSKIALKKGRYRVGQGRQVGQKWPKNEERHQEEIIAENYETVEPLNQQMHDSIHFYFGTTQAGSNDPSNFFSLIFKFFGLYRMRKFGSHYFQLRKLQFGFYQCSRCFYFDKSHVTLFFSSHFMM